MLLGALRVSVSSPERAAALPRQAAPSASQPQRQAEAQRARPGHIPGEVGIWVFVLGDMSVFALLFGTFVYYRAQDLALYVRSQATLDRDFGAINTLFLLTSSWLVALGVEAVRLQQTRRAPRLFAAAFACGIGFVVVKFLEYGAKLQAGIEINTNDFYAFYFMLTGLHFVHVVIGLVVLGFVMARSRRPEEGRALVLMESGATYWHMVDVLWVVLFPLLYLLR